MNVRTALISSALLLAVLGWACQQQGPASPSALSTPGGAAGGVSLDAAGGVTVGVKPGVTCPGHPSCPKDEEPTDGDLQRFNVIVTSTSGHISSATQTTNGPKGGLLVKGFTLDLKDFFEFKLTCGGTTPPILGEQTGNLNGTEGPEGSSGHAVIGLGFTHEGISHDVSLKGIITNIGNWPPATGTENSMTENPAGDGIWWVDAGGRGHQNGCTGEGVGIVFTATVVPCDNDPLTSQQACAT